MTTLATFLLEQKRAKDQEYTFHLFEKCNLKCGFCWQDHKAMEGVDTVREKLKPATELVLADPRRTFTFNLMGGELFDDDIFDQALADDYHYLCVELNKVVQQQGKSAKFNLVTNLVTNQPELVRALVTSLRSAGVNISLCTSYDAKGRFRPADFETFKANVELLREYISGFSMLLTKPIIKNLIKGQDAYFDYLYKQGFYIYFDYYTPAEDHMVMAPSDKDLYTVFCYLIDNYPNVDPIRSWINNMENEMSCRTSKLILADGSTCTCGNLIADNTHVITFFRSPISRQDNDAIENDFLNRHNCIECEYFKRCTLGCYTQHNFMKRGETEHCPFKMTFDKIVKGITYPMDQITTTYGT